MRRPVCLALTTIALCGAAPFDERFEEIKRAASAGQLYAFLYALPKGGDLHHHFGLAGHAETWFQAATDPAINGGNEFYARTRFQDCPGAQDPLIRFRTIQRATYEKLSACGKSEYTRLAALDPAMKAEWLSAMKLDRPGEGRTEFFDVIVRRLGDLVTDPRLLTEMLVKNLQRYGREGIRYLETQIGGGALKDQAGNPVTPQQWVAMLRSRLAQPDARATGVTVQFQAAVYRSRPQAEEMLEQAYAFVAANRDLLVGINLLGPEYDDRGHPLRFLETFRRMRRTYSGIGLSIHAGEVDSPGPQVRNTLLLGASRIGHGVNLIQDPDTMLLMRNGPYLVEVSLISNRLLEYTPDLSKHPFPEYLRFGIPVCLNTDDAGSWDSNLTDEYFTAVKTFHLAWKETVALGRNSLVHSFAEAPVKERMLREYDAAVLRFEETYAGDWRSALGAVKAEPTGYAARTFGVAAR